MWAHIKGPNEYYLKKYIMGLLKAPHYGPII